MGRGKKKGGITKQDQGEAKQRKGREEDGRLG